jgi:hypothetical protein
VLKLYKQTVSHVFNYLFSINLLLIEIDTLTKVKNYLMKFMPVYTYQHKSYVEPDILKLALPFKFLQTKVYYIF